MSKATRQPAAQNFLVEIKDTWARPGIICASVTWYGSHVMSRLHVCVDVVVLPLSNVMVIAFVAFFLLTTGVPSTKKRPVAPESDMA